MALSQTDKQELKNVLIEVLSEKRGIDPETHTTHHLYVGRLIERDQKRERWKERVRLSIIGSIVVSLVGILGAGLAALGAWVLRHLHS